MPKSAMQKYKLLYLKECLETCTDEEHPMTTAQLIAYLADRGVSAERKSIYDDLEALAVCGLDVGKKRMGSATGWYVGQRDFQLAELKLLVDSVQASRFITQKKSAELIGKLSRLTSTHQAKTLQRQVLVKNRVKNMNESIYYLVDDIHAAIAARKQISFQYYAVTARRERVYRRGGKRYVVSPYALLWAEENYYLLSYDAAEGIIKHFRVDKMASLAVTDRPREGEDVFAKLDMAAYTATHFSMFSGTTETVRLEFREDLAGAVIDRFGEDAMLIPTGDGRFTVTVQAVLCEPFYGWLCSFGSGVRLLSPARAVAALREHVRSIAALYAEDETQREDEDHAK